ncbi:MAG: biosynthetic peptidoglycan transglycosylase, partial [Myxococcota bacterium]|nr:biosynthetic peptidoglycan transglycosylase [Myxococcota bacterium]
DAGWFAEAAIAAEDIRFREHPGYDLVAIQEAIDAAPNEARIRGGSTITQQLVKNIFLDGRRTLRRKFRELLLSLALEDRMSKDGILQLYINVVEFGPNIRGIGQAADAWFLKRPDQLTPREAAFLSAILPAPNAWHERIARTGTPPVVVVDRVLDRMRRKGVLSAEQHRRARTTRLRLVPP